ncbi:MAG: hypothetical protein WA945_11830 [Arcobacteraceae bacterium]
MSADLLLNLDKPTSKKATLATNASSKTEVGEKKGGQSLFDSLLSQAKQEPSGTKKEQTASEKKTQDNTETKTESKTETLADKKTQNNVEGKQETSSDKKIQNSVELKIATQLEKKTQDNTETKTETSRDKKIDNTIEAKTENTTSKQSKIAVNNKTQTAEEITSNLKNAAKTISVTVADEAKNTQSLQKMVDKLVDIVVTAAKDILDKNPEKTATTNTDLNKIVKNTVEEVINNKLADVSDKEKVKILINDKLEIIKSSVKIIKSEMQNEPTSSESKNISSDTQKSIVNKSEKPSVVNSKELDAVIETEVKTIKENIQEIKKEVLSIVSDNSTPNDTPKETKNQNSVAVKDEKGAIQEIKKEVSNIIESVVDITEQDDSKNKELAKEITTSLTNIDKSSDDIESEISKLPNNKTIEVSKSDVTQEVKIIHNNVEGKLNQIENEVTKIQEKVSEIIIVKTTDDKITQSTTQVTTKINLSTLSSGTSSKLIHSDEKPLLAAMFLNAQKSIKEKTSLEQVHDAKINIIEKKTLESVKASAEKLDLGLNKTDIKREGNEAQKSVPTETKKEESRVNNLFNSRDLNRAFLDQRIESNNLVSQRNQQVMQQQEEVSIIEESKKTVDTVELAVPKEAVQIIQSKIIGAHQKMGSFMSEVARNMYLNYKPPVTAFRVNLNPANLGSISIIMKANKVDNSLSVSMNLSNSNTMEAFTENKVALQNAIQRQFTETSNVSINFNMQDQGSQDSFNQSNQNGRQEEQKNTNSESNAENSEEQEIIEHNDYM